MNIKHCFQFYSRMIVGGLSLATLLPVTVQAQTVSWTRRLGTSSDDFSTSVATDSKGNVYISGSTSGSLGGAKQGLADAWIAKYNSTGTLVWTKQLGTSDDEEKFSHSTGVAIDSKGNIYISGYTSGYGINESSRDAWVAKYNTAGTLLWKKQLGTSISDFSTGVATDSKSNVYISGSTHGSLGGANQGLADAWVVKYNTAGTLVWKKQLGTSDYDFSYGVATDSKGNVYISSFTNGEANQGSDNAWAVKYNTPGTLLWKKQLGDSSYEHSSLDGLSSIATDSKDNIYFSGSTYRSLEGANQGNSDAWVAKYSS